MQAHKLDSISSPGSKYKFRCRLCQQEWITYPTGMCPGVKVFSSRDPIVCPQRYKTLEELETEDLRPKWIDRPSAAFRASRRGTWVFLYDETEAVPKGLADAIGKVLKRVFGLLAWLVNIIAVGIISVLVGLNPAPASPTSIPIISFVLQHQFLSLVIVCGVALLTLIGTLLFFKQIFKNDQQLLRWYLQPSGLVTLTSTASFLLSFMLLVVVLLRPSWCPTSLCPAPQHILNTHPQSIHDENLEMYSIAIQSTSYVIPGDPAHYSADNLPMSIGALLINGNNASPPYKLAFGLESLQQGRFGLVIQEVDLVVHQVAPIPHPLNVWTPPSSITYNSEDKYLVLYLGQTIDAVIPSAFLTAPSGFVHLKPRESDRIDVEITSLVESNVWFSIQFTYRIDNQLQLHTLRLPQKFEVMFANHSDWHLYNG